MSGHHRWELVSRARSLDSSDERTVRCPYCRELYVWYRWYAGDQSACMRCRMVARRRDAVSLILARDQHRLLSRLGIATDVDAEYVKEAFRSYSSRTDGPGKR